MKKLLVLIFACFITDIAIGQCKWTFHTDSEPYYYKGKKIYGAWDCINLNPKYFDENGSPVSGDSPIPQLRDILLNNGSNWECLQFNYAKNTSLALYNNDLFSSDFAISLSKSGTYKIEEFNRFSFYSNNCDWDNCNRDNNNSSQIDYGHTSFEVCIIDFKFAPIKLPSQAKNNTFCIYDQIVDLRKYIGYKDNISFTGTGIVSSYYFNPAKAGVGKFAITASANFDNGNAIAYDTLTVNDFNRESYFDVSSITFCADAQAVKLDTVTKGHPNGTWSGDGILNGNTVNVTSAAGSSTVSVNKTYAYTWTNSLGCTNTQNYSITIAPSFSITSGSGLSTCDNKNYLINNGFSPTGGTWSSPDPNLNARIFKNTIRPEGLTGANSPGKSYPLVYTVNQNGCVKSKPNNIFILTAPKITYDGIYYTNDVYIGKRNCADLTNFNMNKSVSSTSKGKWTFDGVNNDNESDIKSFKLFYNDSLLNVKRMDSLYRLPRYLNCDGNCEFTGTYTVSSNTCSTRLNVAFTTKGLPTAPVTTGASACVVNTSSQIFTLSATSGSVGNYGLYWYTKMDTAKTNTPYYVGDKNLLSMNTVQTPQTITYYARNKDLITGCYSAYTPATATVNPIPTVSAGTTDQKICQNVISIQLTNGSATIGTKPVTNGSGVWSSALGNVSSSGTFTNNNLPLGSYAVTYTYTTPEKCSASGVKNVNVVAIPIVSIGADNFVCGNIGIHKLNGLGESPVGGTWSILNTKFSKFLKKDSLLIDSLPALSTQNLKYTFTNADNCVNSATRNVSLYEVPTSPQLIGGKVCGEGSVTLSALGAKGSESYYWYDSLSTKLPFNQTATFTTPSLIQSRYYYVSKKNLSGCEGKKDSVLAKLVALTPVTVNGNTEIQICKSVNNTNMNQFVNPKKGKFSFASITMLNDSVLATSTADVGVYPFSYSFVNIEGCTTKVDNNVRVSLNPTLVLQPDTVICKNTKSFVLKSNVLGGKWSGSVAVDSSGNFDPSKLTIIGNYVVNYIFNKYGCNVSGSSKINFVDRPLTPLISGVASGCENDSLTFIASSNENGVRFNFYRNTDTIPFSNSIITKVKNTVLLNKVSVEAINNFGCPSLAKAEKATEVFTISGDYTANPTFIIQGDLVRFASTVTTSPNDRIKSYDWNFGDSTARSFGENAVHYYLDTANANVTLHVTSQNNCHLVIKKSKLVKVLKKDFNIQTAAQGSIQETTSINTENDIRFFPNPSETGMFSFSAYVPLHNVMFEIYSPYSGVSIYSSLMPVLRNAEIDLTDYPAGLYLCVIKDMKGNKREFKLIKK